MCVLLPPAVAVVQSLPIFDQTRLFSLPLPAALGHSLSFSYTLQLYLVLMFLGQAPLSLSFYCRGLQPCSSVTTVLLVLDASCSNTPGSTEADQASAELLIG